MRNRLIKYLSKMRGGESSPPRKPFHKIVWSWFGAFIGIYLIGVLHEIFSYDYMTDIYLIGSFGASAVLVYGVPQAELSQPRNLIGGHLISALIGVSVYKYLPFDITLLSALAVSLSIAFMHITRTLHPPGGATALIAVIGSSRVHAEGYLYVLAPVGAGAVILLLVALLINNLSSDSRRHYPRFWL